LIDGNSIAQLCVSDSADPLDDPRGDPVWNDWIGDLTLEKEVAPYLGMRWRVRVD